MQHNKKLDNKKKNGITKGRIKKKKGERKLKRKREGKMEFKIKDERKRIE
jgi:hypothetical protein